MTEIDNPFDGEAFRAMQQPNITEQIARDYVVMRYLKLGDTRALAHWLERDYNPGKLVKKMLSFMLQPTRVGAEDPSKTYSCSFEAVPFELKTKRRDGKRGAPRNPVSDEKNRIVGENYDLLMAEIGKGGHESAIAQLIEQLGPDINESAIREAIKARSPKSGP